MYFFGNFDLAHAFARPVGGAAVGLALLGPLGAVLGLGTGLAAAASFLNEKRYFRR